MLSFRFRRLLWLFWVEASFEKGEEPLLQMVDEAMNPGSSRGGPWKVRGRPQYFPLGGVQRSVALAPLPGGSLGLRWSEGG